HERVAPLLVHPPADLLEAKLVAVEIHRGVEIAHAQHGVQKSHGDLLTFDHRLGQGRYMIAPDLKTGIARLQDLIAQANVVLPFAGAGSSTEGGIPDFRPRCGIWTKLNPIEFGDFLASQAMRDESWRRRFVMEEEFGGAKPGGGHLALASLYRAGKV